MTQPSPAPSARKSLLGGLDWLAAILVTVIIVGLHFYFLSRAGGFWRDEVNLINLAGRHSVGEMAKDSFPVLMPLLVKVCLALGLSADGGGLRLLGTFIGLGIVAGLWLVSWTTRRSPPLAGLVLVGLNSTVISFGDSLRAYGFGSLMITLTFAAAVVFLKRTGWKRAGLVAVLAVLGVQTLFHDAVLVGAICLGVVVICARRKNWRAVLQILTAGLLAAVSLLPYLHNLMAAKENSFVLRTGLAWPRFMADLTVATGFPWKSYIFVWGAVSLLVLTGAAWALLAKKAAGNNFAVGITRDEANLFAGATLLFGGAGYLGFLWMTAMPGQPWYFLPIMVLAAACSDATVSGLRGHGRTVLVGGALVTTAISVPVACRDLDYRFTNIDAWSRGLMTEAPREDFILVLPWFCGITFDHYFHGETPWTTIPPIADHSTARYDLVRDEIQKTDVLKPVLEKISATLRSGHRVWLLAPVGALKIPAPGSPPPRNLPPAPLPGSGWADEPYTAVWAMQAMHFLSSNSRTFQRVDNPDQGRHIAENMELFVAEGWRDSGSPASGSKSK